MMSSPSAFHTQLEMTIAYWVLLSPPRANEIVTIHTSMGLVTLGQGFSFPWLLLICNSFSMVLVGYSIDCSIVLILGYLFVPNSVMNLFTPFLDAWLELLCGVVLAINTSRNLDSSYVSSG